MWLVCNNYKLVLPVKKWFRTQKWWLNSCVMDTCEDESRSAFSSKVVSDLTAYLKTSGFKSEATAKSKDTTASRCLSASI